MLAYRSNDKALFNSYDYLEPLQRRHCARDQSVTMPIKQQADLDCL